MPLPPQPPQYYPFVGEDIQYAENLIVDEGQGTSREQETGESSGGIEDRSGRLIAVVAGYGLYRIGPVAGTAVLPITTHFTNMIVQNKTAQKDISRELIPAVEDRGNAFTIY